MIRPPDSLLPRAIALALALVPAGGQAGTAEEDWAALVTLDAGPQAKPRSQAEAQRTAVDHIERQERALRTFLSTHPTAPQAFEARLRLARLLQIRSEWQRIPAAREEAQRLLEEAAKIATPEQQVELDFARLTSVMRTMKGASNREREQLLSAARRFQAAHPDDRRVPAVLLEVASIFSHQPRIQRELLRDAQTLAQSEEQRARIADDLKRLDLVGSQVPLRFTSVQGSEFDIASAKGKVVALIFFADWSPPSVSALKNVQKAVNAAPEGAVQAVGVSLDNSAETLRQLLGEHGVTWPVAFDGKGWESPLVRGLGINALPAVWLIDAKGRLRSLRGNESTLMQIRQLAAER